MYNDLRCLVRISALKINIYLGLFFFKYLIMYKTNMYLLINMLPQYFVTVAK